MQAESRNMAITPDPSIHVDDGRNKGLASSGKSIDQCDSRNQTSRTPDVDCNAQPSNLGHKIRTWRRTQKGHFMPNRSNGQLEEPALVAPEAPSKKNKAGSRPGRTPRKRNTDDRPDLSEKDALAIDPVCEPAPKKSKKNKTSTTKASNPATNSKKAKAAITEKSSSSRVTVSSRQTRSGSATARKQIVTALPPKKATTAKKRTKAAVSKKTTKKRCIGSRSSSTGEQTEALAVEILSHTYSDIDMVPTLSQTTTGSEKSQDRPTAETQAPDSPIRTPIALAEDDPTPETRPRNNPTHDIPTQTEPNPAAASEFSDEEEGLEDEEEEEEISGPSESMDMLESLMAIDVLDDITRGALAINEATRMNLEMQQQVKDQLRWINERINVTQGMMRQVHSLASKEIAAGDKPSKIYKEYPDKIDYFVDDDGNYLSLGQTRDFADIGAILKRAWSVAERRRLFGAIHAEAQRAFVLDIMAKGEEHRIWEIDKLAKSELEMIPVGRLDWKRISTLYVKTRTPTQCIIQWTTQEHPAINKKPWTNAESKRLMELVNEHSIYGNWEVIARDHKSNRTASQCFSHYQALQNNKISKKKWTAEEDEALKEAVSLLGERNWQHVAAMFAQRTGNQCLQRWTKSINPAIRREKWKKEEDEILRRAVASYGAGNWTRIQKHLPGRTDMQVRERYMNVLDPSLNLTPSTEEEEDRLWDLVEKHGRKWSMLTEFFPGRTDNRLLRMYKAAEKRHLQKENGSNPAE